MKWIFLSNWAPGAFFVFLESPELHHLAAGHMPGCVFGDTPLLQCCKSLEGSSTEFPVDSSNCFPMPVRFLCPVSHHFFFMNRLVQTLFIELANFPSINVKCPCFVAKTVSCWFRVLSCDVVPVGFGNIIYQNIGFCPLV